MGFRTAVAGHLTSLRLVRQAPLGFSSLEYPLDKVLLLVAIPMQLEKLESPTVDTLATLPIERGLHALLGDLVLGVTCV